MDHVETGAEAGIGLAPARMSAYTRAMSKASTRPAWPTGTLIRIIRGEVNGVPVRDALAACDPIYPNSYTIATGEKSGELIVRGEAGDSIDSWEDMAAAPVSLLRDLRGAFEGLDEYSPGMGIDGHRIGAVRAVLACLHES